MNSDKVQNQKAVAVHFSSKQLLPIWICTEFKQICFFLIKSDKRWKNVTDAGPTLNKR